MEDLVVFEAAATFVLSAALATYVAAHRRRTSLHSAVLVLLLTFMAWSSGLILLHGSSHAPGPARAGALITFAGVMLAVPLWLALCAKLARVALVVERPRAVLWALLVPAFLDFAVLATDDWHGLFARGRAEEMLSSTTMAWAGPLFWLHCLWAYGCVVCGIVLCLRTALASGVDPIHRKQLLLVALGAAIPGISTGIVMLGVLPPGFTLTPGDLGASALCLVIDIARYRFLEPSPVPARAVISHLRDALVLADASGAVVDANPAAEALFGEATSGLRGRSLAAVLELLDPDGELAAELAGGDGELRERTLVTAEERVLDASSGRVAGSDGRVVGSFLVLRDRTQQHRRERRRHQSQRLESLGVIAAGIAHEINNPLAFVRTNLAHLAQLAGAMEKWARMLPREETEQIAEIREILLETQGGIDRISRIVEATRKLSREPRRDRTPVDLNDVALAALQIAPRSHDFPVETDLAPRLPPVWGSGEQLGQVVLNLLINAAQAAGPGSAARVRLSTGQAGEAVALKVEDSGPGVAPEARERIFDPFYTTKGPDEGTGLGLAIAFEIASQHGGSLTLGASALGGACLCLSLPACRGTAPRDPC